MLGLIGGVPSVVMQGGALPLSELDLGEDLPLGPFGAGSVVEVWHFALSLSVLSSGLLSCSRLAP